MMSLEKDIPSYKNLGNVYKGDYYEEIPFDEYIYHMELPKGENVFDIRDFGAVSGGEILNTKAFEKAADECEKRGGGVILVDGGSYTTGTVWIPSNTTLFISKGSEIVASKNYENLLSKSPRLRQKQGTESSEGAFVRAQGAENITITGGGRISGSGEWYVYEPKEKPALMPFESTRLPRRDQAKQINTVPDTIRYYYRQRIRYAEDKYDEGIPHLKRPGYMVWIEDTKGVNIENIVLHDAMCWTLHIDCCEDIHVKDMVIDDNRHVANTDGIDLTACKRAVVEHCFVSCADDGLCLKNPVYTDLSMEDITFRNCVVISVMNAFKIGTGTYHDIRGVLVENCRFIMPDIYPGSVSGISIESCDGSTVENITLRNITMDKVQCPIYILLNKRNEAKDAYTENVDENAYWGGHIRNVLIENVTATNMDIPCIITGFAMKSKAGIDVCKRVEDVTIRNVELSYRDSKEIVEVPDEIPEFLEDYPECNAHGDVDACGIWSRHTKGLRLDNVSVVPRKCNTRSLFKSYDAV